MLPQSKLILAIDALSVTAGGTHTGTIDTLGYDFASIDVIMATSNATTNNPTVFKLVESDATVTNITSVDDITAFVGDTAWTIPAEDTNNGNTYKFNVDLRGRKRYLGVRISPLTTQLVSVTANLFRGDEAPISATKANVDAIVEG